MIVVYRSRYEPQSRRFNGGVARRHRQTVGVAGRLGVPSEMGVVRRLNACAGYTLAI